MKVPQYDQCINYCCLFCGTRGASDTSKIVADAKTKQKEAAQKELFKMSRYEQLSTIL